MVNNFADWFHMESVMNYHDIVFTCVVVSRKLLMFSKLNLDIQFI